MTQQSRRDARLRKAATIALIVALSAGLLLLRNFISMIIVAVIIAFLFSPIYTYLNKRTKSEGRAAALTLLISILVIFVPLALIFAITLAQATQIVNDVSKSFNVNEVSTWTQQLLDNVNRFLSNLTGREIVITIDQVWAQLSELASQFANFLIEIIKDWVGSIGSIITNAILYIYVFTGLLVNQDKIIGVIKRINPLGPINTELYMNRAGEMTKGMVRGQFIIAALQGVVAAISLHIAGLPYFSFFLLVLIFLSVIPLGAGIVTIPIGIILILLGQVWQGVLVLLTHFLIVTNIDNVLKPKLVPKSVRLHPALTLLSVFGGISLFGFLGIIVGPVLMILITTTTEIYLKTLDNQ